LNVVTPTTGLPHVSYFNSAVLIFISGLAAAWVAHEIRLHLEAALRDVETRRQMDQIDRDLDAARSIQRALLPRSAPSIPGYDIAGWNRPAGQTGGDYYDWQTLADGTCIVTLADVSGHGIGPAMVTAACRAYVRASGDLLRDLPGLTARINRLLADDLLEGRFVTMVSVLIDSHGGPPALLSAGHGPIVLYVSHTGSVRDVLPSDLPLAIIPDAAFGPAQPIEMSPGDVLALVTDGLVEWARPGHGGERDQFGLDRLRDALRRHAGLPAAAMIEAITREVTAFADGTPQQDDLTMVIVRRT
jgi:serine phosphatase RsbU (regulator of sigma subunit)